MSGVINVSLAFAGRESELDQLHALFAQRRHVLLIGPAGIGKSALLNQVRSRTPLLVCEGTSKLSRICDGLEHQLGWNHHHLTVIERKNRLLAYVEKRGPSLSPLIMSLIPTVNEIVAQDIQRLDATDLTTLLRKLLLSGVTKHGLALSAVSVAYVLQARDGGEDGRVQWQGGLPHTDWLPSRYCSFQCKATEMTRAKCIKEVLNDAKIDVVPKVDAVLSAGGTYIAEHNTPRYRGANARADGHISGVRFMFINGE